MRMQLSQVTPDSVFTRLIMPGVRYIMTPHRFMQREGTTMPETCDPSEEVEVFKEAPKPTLLQRFKNWLDLIT